MGRGVLTSVSTRTNWRQLINGYTISQVSLLVKIIYWSTPCLISIFDGRCQTAFWLSLFLSENTNLIYGDFFFHGKQMIAVWTIHLVSMNLRFPFGTPNLRHSFYFSITLSMDRLLLSFYFSYNQSGLSFRPLLSRSLMRLSRVADGWSQERRCRWSISREEIRLLSVWSRRILWLSWQFKFFHVAVVFSSAVWRFSVILSGYSNKKKKSRSELVEDRHMQIRIKRFWQITSRCR